MIWKAMANLRYGVCSPNDVSPNDSPQQALGSSQMAYQSPWLGSLGETSLGEYT
jgi:hypothetical protein